MSNNIKISRKRSLKMLLRINGENVIPRTKKPLYLRVIFGNEFDYQISTNLAKKKRLYGQMAHYWRSLDDELMLKQKECHTDLVLPATDALCSPILSRGWDC